ncbi:MAG: hypothetical protein PHO20_04325 [Candidatus Peribacteraceae bacterium]|nr:hypothetical protein [Candidatus Peribacteraceae bacterium]MDD5739966.1 hypothetical protein [Candidatus Peribacteraceae bacterium]
MSECPSLSPIRPEKIAAGTRVVIKRGNHYYSAVIQGEGGEVKRRSDGMIAVQCDAHSWDDLVGEGEIFDEGSVPEGCVVFRSSEQVAALSFLFILQTPNTHTDAHEYFMRLGAVRQRIIALLNEDIRGGAPQQSSGSIDCATTAAMNVVRQRGWC